MGLGDPFFCVSRKIFGMPVPRQALHGRRTKVKIFLKKSEK